MRALRYLPLLMVAWLASASAASLDGVTLPDHYPVDGQNLTLNGIGVRTLTIFSVKIYVAGLYVAQPSHNAQQIMQSPEPKVLVLQFLHAGSKADVEKEYRKGEEVNCGGGGCSPADAPDFERLIAAAPAVAVGDTTTYIFSRNGVEVLANNRQIFRVANKDLAYRLLAGFIGEHPPSPELRASLLGLPSN